MNTYIDIAISLILIFLIFSVVVYVLQEVVAVNLEYRGKMLWKSLAQVLDGVVLRGRRALKEAGVNGAAAANTPVTNLFFNHAQIRSLEKDLVTLPSYIPSSNFALTLIDVVAKKAPAPVGNLFADFTAGLPVFTAQFAHVAGGNTPRPVVEVLGTLSGIATNITDLQEAIEKWYNEYMNRVSGWYQAHTVFTIRLIAIAITVAFNLNCIRLVKDIGNNSILRANLTGIAVKIVDQNALDTAKARAADQYTAMNIRALDSLTGTVSAVSLPIGWRTDFFDNECKIHTDFATGLGSVLLVLLGWLITAGCLSMGAPFWFNLLIQLVNVRRAGVKPGGDKKK